MLQSGSLKKKNNGKLESLNVVSQPSAKLLSNETEILFRFFVNCEKCIR